MKSARTVGNPSKKDREDVSDGRGSWFALVALLGLLFPPAVFAKPHKTVVSIRGEDFLINGKLTYPGKNWNGHRLEGLLFNSRMVQGIFDDANPETVSRWAYPNTHKWDPDRNTNEFIAALPEWRRHGLLAFTINLQGGSPEGYSKAQPWLNSAFTDDGSLKPAYMARLTRILDRADELGMVVIVGFFYNAQAAYLKDEAAVVHATNSATRFLLQGGWRNVMVEVDNECDIGFKYDILGPQRVAELIKRVQTINDQGRRLLAGTSYKGGAIPNESVVRVSDFLLLHGNGVSEPDRITEMVRKTRAVSGYTTKPILFNEDDHYDFDKSQNNLTAAIGEHTSWGYFDYRMKGESFDDGYQSVPVNWGISSDRKRGFFNLMGRITSSDSSR